MGLLFWLVFAFISLDLAILRRRSADISMEAFGCTPMRALIMCSFFILLTLISLHSAVPFKTFASLMLLYTVGIYLTGRSNYKRLLISIDTELASPKIIVASAMLGLLLMLAIWGIIGGLMYGAMALAYKPLTSRLVLDLIFYVYFTVLVLMLIVRFSRQQSVLSLPDLMGFAQKKLSLWKVWVVPVILGIGCAVIGSLVLSGRPEIPTPFTKMVNSINTPTMFLLFAGSAVLLAPIIEEIVFRGFVFAVVKAMGGTVIAVILTAGIFMLMHVQQYWGDALKIVMIGVLSGVLTFLRAWTGSVIPGMVAHFTTNFTIMFVGVISMALANGAYFQYSTQYDHLKPSEREELLLKSIKQNPDLAEPYNELAWQYAQENRHLDKALSLIDKGLAREPQNGAFLDTKAEVLYKMANVKEAIRIETGLVERYPKVQLYRDQLKKFKSGVKSSFVLK